MAADLDTVSEEKDYAAWAIYRKAKIEEIREKRSEGRGETEKSENREEGRTLNGCNRRAGERNRRYTWNSGYHYAPQCPQTANRSSGPSRYQRVSKKPSNQPWNLICMSNPQTWMGSRASTRKYERALSRNLEAGGQFVCVHDDNVVELDAGAPANLVCFEWLGHRNSRLWEMGIP